MAAQSPTIAPLLSSVSGPADLERAKALPQPALPSLAEQPYGVLVTGIGGTGVITIGALLGMAGHLEGKGCVQGSLRLRDRHYAVDCIDGVNKSWGPRNDWGNKGGTWVHVNLGPDLGAFLVLGLEFENKEVVYGPFKFGYVVVDGERRPLVRATMRAQRFDMLVTRAVVEFEDDRGNCWDAVGTTVAAAPWYNFNPSSAAFQTLMRWESGTRVGHSHIADFAGLAHLSRGMADKHDT